MRELTPPAPMLDATASADGMVATATTLFEYLATAVALSRDRELVRTIRARTGRDEDALVLSFAQRGPFVRLAGDAVAGSSIDLPPGPSDVLDLADVLARDATVQQALARAQDRAGVLPEVAGWLRSFASGADAISRETFRAIATWHPIIAVEAYRHLTYAGAALDGTRRDLLREAARPKADPRTLLAYWTLVHMIGTAALLATMGDERAWLGELAANVPPGGWTPSFLLVRERCFRLALRAGWAAAGFGGAAVPRYFAVLSGSVAPLRAFDAVVGLTAIGVRHRELAARIERELKVAIASTAAAAPPSHRAFFEAMNRSAALALGDPSRAADLAMERALRLGEARSGLGEVAGPERALDGIDIDDDCAEVEGGVFPCILALALVVPRPAEEMFSPAAGLARRARSHPRVHERARAVLLRTGPRAPDDPGGRPLN